MRYPLTVGTLLFLLIPAAPAGGQQFVRLGTELDDYLRFLELEGGLQRSPLVFRSPSVLQAVSAAAGDTAHPWAARYPFAPEPAARGVSITLLDPELHGVYNSRYPRGTNDGALWAGRGASFALSAGARIRWGPLTAVLDPLVYYVQNRDFDLSPGAERDGLKLYYAYAYSGGTIDWPERFGNQAYAQFDWGQSGLRLDLGGFTAGISTENMWWGPARQNPIIMSNTAPGFPHIDLGTRGPVWVGVGHLDARLVWGALSESQYFDTIPANDHRLFTGMVLGFQPRWIPGVTVGATRVFYQTWDSLSVADFFDVFQTVFKGQFATPTDPQGNDLRDQLLSLIASWTFPQAGFNAYVEWARNDHNVNLRDFLIQPDHSRAYTLGFQQVVPSGGGRIRLTGEVTTLGKSATAQSRATPTYYEHNIVRQGYTQRGQLLGAGIGPGSQSQTFTVDRYDRNGRWGFELQRVGIDNDAYYKWFQPWEGFYGNWTELTAAVRGARFVGPLLVSASVGLSRELNRHYQVGYDVTNLMLDLGVRFQH